MDASISTELQRLRFSIVYTSHVTTGVSILVVLSILSLIAVLGLLVCITLSAWNTRKVQDTSLFVRSHVAAYFLSLMLCWLIQCIGSLMSIQWLKDKIVVLGNVCIAQGVLKHIADVGIALWTFVIAAHTFSCLFLDLRTSRYVMAAVLSFGWIIIALVVGSGPSSLDTKRRGSFYDVSGYGCWISPEYKVQRITLGYMIMLLSAFLSAVLYILTFLRQRGNIIREGWRLQFRLARVSDDGSTTHPDNHSADDHTAFVAKQMMLYPLSYAVLISPTATIQLITWSGRTVELQWVIFGASFYTLSGFVNVILFATTRQILPWSSVKIGNRSLVVPESPESKDQDEAEKGASKAVTSPPDPTTTRRQSTGSTKAKHRPPQLTLPSFRDTWSGMYTPREDKHVGPVLSSHWSPETPPLQSRVSRTMQSLTEMAHKI